MSDERVIDVGMRAMLDRGHDARERLGGRLDAGLDRTESR
jgi:hypothetical protein